jgi:hypothetical protein
MLGGIFPLTGRLGASGIQRESAARLAVEYINNRTSLLPNTKITFFTADSGSLHISYSLFQ